MSIIFSASGMSNLTLERGRMLPYTPEEVQINQERYLTESNNAKVIDYGTDISFISLVFMFLSQDNYDGSVNGLKTWFEDSNINWSENSFTMTDEAGTAWTVRLWQSDFKMPKMRGGRFMVELILKVE